MRPTRTRSAVAGFVYTVLLLVLVGALSGCGESPERQEERRNAATVAARQRREAAENEAARRAPTYTARVMCTNCGRDREEYPYDLSGGFDVTVKKGLPVSAVLCPYCQVWRNPPLDGKPGVSTLEPSCRDAELERAISDAVAAGRE